MNGVAILFLLVSAVAMLRLPRGWAPLPLLMGACYMTPGQQIMVGPFHFTILRLLLLVGGVRAMMRHEQLPGGLNGLDWVMLWWGAWNVCSSSFHRPFLEALVLRLGIVYNVLGTYFLIRLFCQSREDMVQLIKITAFVLVPVALEMSLEKRTGRNLFAFLGGVPEVVELRDGKLRAQGPFGHPILAGTVGAVCLPLMIGIWRQHGRTAKIGIAACLAMVVASKSSGPLMSLTFGVLALCLWRWRHLTRQMRIGAVLGYLLLEVVMKDPAYFVMARIDLTGSSTGWHRAELIHSAIAHLNEWWFAGTDYTRHWMVLGLPDTPNHCDITNHYLSYGVSGGLPLMLLFVCALGLGFRYIGVALRSAADAPLAEQFLIWAVGAGLFAHTATCFSVSYFEQSVVFLYLNLAVAGSLHATGWAATREQPVAAPGPRGTAVNPEPAPGTGLPTEHGGHLVGTATVEILHHGLRA